MTDTVIQNSLAVNSRALQRVSIRLFSTAILCMASTPAWTAFDETYQLAVGGVVTDFDSGFRINSRDGSIDNEIDAEQDLGFESRVQLGWLRGIWRMADRHRLSVLYVPIRRTTELTNRTDLDVGGNVIKAGAFIGASVETHLFDIEYAYSFYKRPNVEIGISGGLYWMNSLIELTAAGEIILEGSDQSEYRADYEANQRLIAPLPLLGLSAAYEINPQWKLFATARYFDVTISDIEGRILNLSLETEYYFTNHVGLGAALSTFELNVKQNGVVFINTVEYQYTGIGVYLVLKY